MTRTEETSDFWDIVGNLQAFSNNMQETPSDWAS